MASWANHPVEYYWPALNSIFSSDATTWEEYLLLDCSGLFLDDPDYVCRREAMPSNCTTCYSEAPPSSTTSAPEAEEP